MGSEMCIRDSLPIKPNALVAFSASALTLLVGQQEGHLARKTICGDGGGGHWLVRMEWCPVGWSVSLPLLISPCTIVFRSSFLALAHPGGRGKRAIKRLWCGGVNFLLAVTYLQLLIQVLFSDTVSTGFSNHF